MFRYFMICEEEGSYLEKSLWIYYSIRSLWMNFKLRDKWSVDILINEEIKKRRLRE